MPAQTPNNTPPTSTSTTSSRTLLAFLGGFALALIVSLVFLVPIARAFGDAPPPDPVPTQPSADSKLVASQFEKTRYHQKRADHWAHRLKVHDDLAHRKLVSNLNLKFEAKRTAFWKTRADKWQDKWQVQQTRLRSCNRAGFPRWYCPILIEATDRRGVSSWSSSTDLAFIIRHESGFNPRADNPTSTAYGLFQMLVETSSDPYRQTINGVKYVQGRYGSPSNAVAFWHKNRWY